MMLWLKGPHKGVRFKEKADQEENIKEMLFSRTFPKEHWHFYVKCHKNDI